MTKKEKRQPMQTTGRKRPSSTGEEKRQPMQSTRCMETIDIEELLEWMVLHPESFPDNNFLYDITRADEPQVEPRFNGMNTEQVFNILKQEEESDDVE